jgi:hypothetical protein
MRNHRRYLFGALCAIGLATSASSAEPGSVVAGASFVVGPHTMFVPEGYFVLVRRGAKTGAFRITRVIAKENPMYGTSHYDSYFQGDGSGLLSAPNVVLRHGDIDIRPLKGFHPFAWQPGQDHLRVGRWTFNCLANQLVNMSLGFSDEDTGFEFAPTSARDLAELDVRKPSLRWFRFDRNTRVQVFVQDLDKQ